MYAVPEHKFTDTPLSFDISATDRANGWTLFRTGIQGIFPNFIPTVAGTSETQIIGRDITLKNIHWRFQVGRGNVSFDETEVDKAMAVRAVIVKDSQPKGEEVPLFNDIWNADTAVGGNMLANLRLSNEKRFRIVHDSWKHMNISAATFTDPPATDFFPASEWYQFNINLDVDQKLSFNTPFDSVFARPTNCNYLFYLLFAGGRVPFNTEIIRLEGNLRCRFTDN